MNQIEYKEMKDEPFHLMFDWRLLAGVPLKDVSGERQKQTGNAHVKPDPAKVIRR